MATPTYYVKTDNKNYQYICTSDDIRKAIYWLKMDISIHWMGSIKRDICTLIITKMVIGTR